MSNDETEQRLTDLEIQTVHHGETIDSLNEALVRQWKEIDRLSREVRQLRELLLSLEDDAGPHKVTKPPHY